MKKVLLMVVAICSFAIVTTSCKESKKDSEKTEMHGEHDGAEHKGESHDVASATFACPMDCEDGKTYEAKGSCPVCKMDLKPASEHAEGCKCQEGGECKCAEGECTCKKEMKHADNCKCKEGGECKCEDGKCECQKEMAVADKECTKCDDGKCECKA